MAASLDRFTFVVANIVGVGLGLVGGYLLAKPKPCDPSAGSLFVVGENTYVDAPFVALLGSNLKRESRGEWTVYLLRDVGIHIQRVSERTLLPGQVGALYLVRDEEGHGGNDAAVQHVLLDLVRLGTLRGGQFWNSWETVAEEGKA